MKTQVARDFSVGFVLFIATIILMVGLFLVGDAGGLLTDQYNYFLKVPSANGLQIGSKVYLSGVPAGKISDVDFSRDPNDDKVHLTLAIHRRHADRIGVDSRGWLQSEGLLGDTSVHVSLRGDSEVLEPGEEIRFELRPLLDELAGEGATESATTLLKTVTAILNEIQRGEGSIGKFFKDPELYDNVNSFSRAMSEATEEIKSVSKEVRHMLEAIRDEKGTLGQLVYSEEYATRFKQVVSSATSLIAHLDEISSKVEAGEGTLGRLVADSKMHDELTDALESISKTAWRLETILTALDGGTSVISKLVHDGDLGLKFEDFLGTVQMSTRSLANILEKLDRGEGSAGMFLNDPSLAASVRDVVLGVQELGYLQNVVRNAELKGRAIRVARDTFSAAQREELDRLRERDDARRDRGQEAEDDGADSFRLKAVPAAGSDEQRN